MCSLKVGAAHLRRDGREALLQLWNKQFLADDICISVMAVCCSLISQRTAAVVDAILL